MKKLLTAALSLALMGTMALPAFAAPGEPSPISPAPEAGPRPGYSLRIDGENTGVRACIMVPLRPVAEQLGFTVTWNGDGTILLDDGTMHSTLTVGEDLYQVVTSVEGMVGMSAPFSLGMAPCVVKDTTYVPLGLFEALLGSQEGAVTVEDGVVSLKTAPLNMAELVSTIQ